MRGNKVNIFRLSDVAVGAPFYTDYTADAFESGRVYVCYQTAWVSFILSLMILRSNKLLYYFFLKSNLMTPV